MTGPANIPVWQRAWVGSRDDPYLFVTGVLGVLPVGADNPSGEPQLEKWQHDALALIGANDRVSIRSGHGVGKTAFICWLILWFVLTRLDCKVPVAANTQNQLRDVVWPEIKKWWRRLPEPLQKQVDVQAERVVLKADPEASFAVARTASKDNTEALAGFHALWLLFLLEEASGIPDIVIEVAMGALSSKGAKAVAIGNPTKASGFFFDTHHKLRDSWKTLVVSSEDVPRARGHIADIISMYGKGSNKYRVRVQGEFPSADDETVIPLELVEGARNRDIATTKFVPVWGVDIARHGDDRCALAKRRGNTLTEPVTWWSGVDLTVSAGKIRRMWEDCLVDDRPSEILIDSIGLGAGVLDMLREQGLPVRGVNVGETPSADDQYARLRDELWFKGRAWFHGRDVKIPADEALIAELTAPTYDFTSNGKIVVEPKKEMKKRGLRSPDLADAFLLTFAGGLDRKIEKRRRWHEESSASAWAA